MCAETSATTVAQSRGARCRNSRIVAYQALSDPSPGQRQSGAKGTRVHTGLPNAPARWQTEVSTVITRSARERIAAVSAKSLKCRPRPMISEVGWQSNTIDPLRIWRFSHRTPESRNRGAMSLGDKDLFPSLGWSGLPAQTMAMEGFEDPPSRCRHSARRSGGAVR